MNTLKNYFTCLAGALMLAACSGSDTRQLAEVSHHAAAIRSSAGDLQAAVTVQGYRDNFTIENASAGVRVTNRVTGAVATYPSPIATIKFVDRHVSFDVEGLSAKVYRLYQAAFNRTPDAEGLGFWIKVAQDGTTIGEIAAGFLASGEFQALYGANPTAEEFVAALYANVLHRPPEQSGYDWWVATVRGGAGRAGALSSFAESPENKLSLMAEMARGFAYAPFGASGPLASLASSYQNKMAASIGPQPIPQLWGGEVIGPAVAYADFFQDGSYSMVAQSADFASSDAHGHSTRPGKTYFFKMMDGKWVDRTSDLLSDQAACLGARKLIVADFNGDGRPDVFASCHGYDGPPYPGENQRMLLSQADGKYRNVDTGILCFCHGASAAVLDRPGYADVLVADQMVERTPYFLINKRDGTFAIDKTRLPATLEYKQVWTAELIDIMGTGRYDVFLAGGDPRGDGYQILPTIFANDGADRFLGKTVSIPLMASNLGPPSSGVTLDVLFHKQSLYLLRTFDYAAMAVQKTNLTTMSSTQPYSHSGSYAPKQQYGNGWFAWIGVYQGRIYSDVADVAFDE